MLRKTGGALRAVAVLGAVGASFLAARSLWAQGGPEQSAGRYDYVGVQQTIARIDQQTGEIEVLVQPGASRASLLTAEARPWRWKRVSVRAGRRNEGAERKAATDEPDRTIETTP